MIESVSISENDEEIFEAPKIFTDLTEQNLSKIWDQFDVPDDVELLCTESLQFADRPPHDCIDIHKHLMDMGLRVHFYHFFHDILSFKNTAPIQLNSNEWACMVSLFYYGGCMSSERKLSPDVF